MHTPAELLEFLLVHGKVRKIAIIFTLNTEDLATWVNRKCPQGDVSGFVQMESGEHSRLQSKDCHSSKVHNCHRETVDVMVDVLVTKV